MKTKYYERILKLVILSVVVCIIMGTTAYGQVVYPGMVSYWKFDDCTANDYVGTNDGTIYGATCTLSGQVNSALTFDGSNDYVLVPDNNSLDIVSSFTFEAWINIEKGGVSILDKGEVDTPNYRWIIGFGDEPLYRFPGVWSRGCDVCYGNIFLSIGTWHHVVTVFDGSTSPGTLKFYVDGEDYGGTCPWLGHWCLGATNAGPLYIGRDIRGRFFKGLIDELAIYNRVLSEFEIQGHYQNGLEGLGYEEIMVDIDIKLGTDVNPINYKSRGKIPVAILSTAKFYAPDMVEQSTLKFGATGNENSLAFCDRWPVDVNNDGHLDLVCHFYTEKAGFKCGDTEGILKGQTVDGIPIQGSESVRIVPCQSK